MSPGGNTHPGSGPAEPALSKKERKRAKELRRPLRPWEQYRAQEFALREAQYLEDLADHKVRFAVLIMGALTGASFWLVTRSGLSDAIGGPRPWVLLLLAPYLVVVVGFFLQAVRALWPGPGRRRSGGRADGGPGPGSVRCFGEASAHDAECYRLAWAGMDLQRLRADLALRIHQMAEINDAKYRALDRVYRGLLIVTVLTAGLIGAALLARFV